MAEKRGARRQAREVALQALFVCDFHGSWNLEIAEFCFEHFCVPKVARHYARLLIRSIIDNRARIDSRITASSENWSINRMSRVDRCLLRIAIVEMFYIGDVPLNVAIDEAVEISKNFGGDESPMFINGVLDRAALSLKNELEVEMVHARTEGTLALADHPHLYRKPL